MNLLALTRREILLGAGSLALLGLALLAPPLAQPPHIHAYADTRLWLGLPRAGDVWSNAPFALFGLWGWRVLRGVPAAALAPAARALAALFFAGLVLTALASGGYHLRPDDAGLFIDRLGMSVAFAGLLGLGAATAVSARAGVALAAAVLLAGAASAALCWRSGNMLPWAVLQGGGVVLLLALAMMQPLPGAPTVRWALVIALYALAKAAESADHAVFAVTGQLVSGHSLKHLIAALAAWPVIGALRRLRQNARA